MATILVLAPFLGLITIIVSLCTGILGIAPLRSKLNYFR